MNAALCYSQQTIAWGVITLSLMPHTFQQLLTWMVTAALMVGFHKYIKFIKETGHENIHCCLTVVPMQMKAIIGYNCFFLLPSGPTFTVWVVSQWFLSFSSVTDTCFQLIRVIFIRERSREFKELDPDQDLVVFVVLINLLAWRTWGRKNEKAVKKMNK